MNGAVKKQSNASRKPLKKCFFPSSEQGFFVKISKICIFLQKIPFPLMAFSIENSLKLTFCSLPPKFSKLLGP